MGGKCHTDQITPTTTATLGKLADRASTGVRKPRQPISSPNANTQPDNHPAAKSFQVNTYCELKVPAP